MAGVINIGAQDLSNLIKSSPDGVEVVDLRTEAEYKQMHIKGSKLIPIDMLEKSMDKIDWSKDVVFICRSGNTSFYAANIAAAAGKSVKNVEGGIIGVSMWGPKDILEA